MRFHFIRIAALCLIACPFLTTTGCDDADAANRLTVANQLKAAADLAFLADSSADLNKVSLSLQAIKGGTDKQMATRDRLLASIQMHEAVLKMGDIEKAEIGLRHDLVRLRAMAFASERLATFSAAREKVSGPVNTPQLNERREQIRSQIEQLRNQANQIDAPVVESVQSLQRSDEEVLKLHRQANRLREEAAMADPVNRFDIIQQAIDLERQADRIEAEMMRRELSLELVQQPAKEMMDRSQADLEGMLAEIDAAQDDLQTLSRQMADSAAKGRASLQEMDAKITELSNDMADRYNDLQTDYQEAEKKLASAATYARKGGKSDGRLGRETQTRLKAQIQLAQADLGLMQVRGLDEWIRILNMLSMNDDLGNRDAWKLQAEEATKRRDAIAEKTVKFIDQSLESGAQSKLINETRTNMEAAKAFLAGEKVESTKRMAIDPKRSAPSARSTSSKPTSTDATGYPSVDSLVSGINMMLRNAQASTIKQNMAKVTYFSDPASNSIEDQERFMDLVEKLDDAAKVKSLKLSGTLGMTASLSGLSGGMDQMMTQIMKSVRLSNPTENGDRGSVTVTSSFAGMEQSDSVALIKVDGKWFIDGDSDSGLGLGNEPQIDFSSLNSSIEKITNDIKLGKIKTQSELDEAIKPLNEILESAQ